MTIEPFKSGGKSQFLLRISQQFFKINFANFGRFSRRNRGEIVERYAKEERIRKTVEGKFRNFDDTCHVFPVTCACVSDFEKPKALKRFVVEVFAV